MNLYCLLELCIFCQTILSLAVGLKASILECYQCHYFEPVTKGDERVQEFLDTRYELAGSEVCHNTGSKFTNSPSIIVSCDVPRGNYEPFCKKTHAEITTTFHGKTLKIDAWRRGCVISSKEKPYQLGCTNNLTAYKRELEGDLFKGSELEVEGRTCYCDANHCNSSPQSQLSYLSVSVGSLIMYWVLLGSS